MRKKRGRVVRHNYTADMSPREAAAQFGAEAGCSVPNQVMQALVTHGGKLTAKELGRETALSPSTVRKALPQLAAAGLVGRERVPGSRAWHYYATRDFGEAFVRGVGWAEQQRQAELFEDRTMDDDAMMAEYMAAAERGGWSENPAPTYYRRGAQKWKGKEAAAKADVLQAYGLYPEDLYPARNTEHWLQWRSCNPPIAIVGNPGQDARLRAASRKGGGRKFHELMRAGRASREAVALAALLGVRGAQEALGFSGHLDHHADQVSWLAEAWGSLQASIFGINKLGEGTPAGELAEAHRMLELVSDYLSGKTVGPFGAAGVVEDFRPTRDGVTAFPLGSVQHQLTIAATRACISAIDPSFAGAFEKGLALHFARSVLDLSGASQKDREKIALGFDGYARSFTVKYNPGTDKRIRKAQREGKQARAIVEALRGGQVSEEGVKLAAWAGDKHAEEVAGWMAQPSLRAIAVFAVGVAERLAQKSRGAWQQEGGAIARGLLSDIRSGNPRMLDGGGYVMRAIASFGQDSAFTGAVRVAARAFADPQSREGRIAQRDGLRLVREVGQKAAIEIAWGFDNAMRQENPRRKKRKPRKSNPQSGGGRNPNRAPRWGRNTTDLERYAHHPGFDQAYDRATLFHGSEPRTARVVRIDDGKKGVTRKTVVALGYVPETHYTAPNKHSNKAGAYWVHPHPQNKEPLEVLDPQSGLTFKIQRNPQGKVTDWWYG